MHARLSAVRPSRSRARLASRPDCSDTHARTIAIRPSDRRSSRIAATAIAAAAALLVFGPGRRPAFAQSSATFGATTATAAAPAVPQPRPTQAAAQAAADASLAGRVSDPAGAPLPGVSVTLAASGRAPLTVVTDADGRYRFPTLPAGSYQLTAELAGFRPHVEPALVIAAGSARMLDLPLALAGVSESVTVLGERAGRSLKDTAASVAVFDATALEQQPGLGDSNELLTRIPNVTSTGTNNQAPAVRGVDGTGPALGADAFLAGTRPRLNVQIDGRPASYNEVVFGDAGLWDVAQVEVYRGPQSTLQGRNAVAGSLFVKTKDPSYKREVQVQAGGGNFKTGQVSAMATGPIIANQFAYRVTFDRHTSESFMQDTAPYPGVSNPGAFDSLGLRGKLLIEPKALAGFSTLVTVTHASHTAPQVESVGRPFDARPASAPTMPTFEPASTGAIVDTKWKASERVTIENTFSYTDVSITRRAEPADGNAQIDGRELVLEPRIRFASQDRRLKAFGGLYVFRAEQDETIDLFGGGAFDDRTRTVAAFGEATYTARQRLDLTVGGRVEQEHRRRVGAGGPFTIDFDATYRVFSPKIGLTWRATDRLTVGAAAARGYNGGSAGFTYEAPFVSYTFKPEFVWNYEAFGRADLADGRLSLTANVFYSDFTDMQLPFDLNPDPRVWSFVIRNAESAHTYGAEIGAKWVGVPGLELRADIGLLRTEIGRFPESGVEGHDMARSPAFTSNVGIGYRHPRGFDASADVRFTDAYYSNINNDPRGKIDPYCMVNAQAGYTVGRTRLFAVLGNLFDYQSPVLLEPGATAAEDTATLLRPRSVSLNLRVAF